VNADEIERALLEDRSAVPSPGFASRVMGAVRRQAQEEEAIGFPWRRLLPGLIGSVALVVTAVVLTPVPKVSDTWLRILQDPAAVRASTLVPVVLLGSWLIAWLPLRLAGFSR
jgi:hypothetical protein